VKNIYIRKNLSSNFIDFSFCFLPISIDYSVLGYVESMLTFFVVLSIYLALKNRIVLSSIAAGFAILTKYNGIFVIPVLLFIVYKYCKNKKTFVKKALIVSVISGIISLPWFIRNWILLGNPIWPFLNFIFKGIEKQSFSGFDISNLFSINTYLATYLGFFGVPDGNYKTLLFVDIPYLGILLPAFLIVSLVFITPLFFGFKKGKNKNIFYVLLISFIALFTLYVVNVGPFVSRMLLPGVLALGFFYGTGLNRIATRYKKLGKIFIILLILISAGFVIVETAKFTIASKSWNFYQEDFDWVKVNTDKNAIFIAGGQCTQYHIKRSSLFPSEIESDKYDYVWVNQNFKLDSRIILNNEQLKELEKKNKELAYESTKTKTKIYKIRR